MAESGQININSADIESAISLLNNSKSALESEAKSGLSGFAALESVGLFSDGLSQIKANIDKVSTSIDSFVSALSSHLASVKQEEEENVEIVDTYGGGSGGGGGGGGGYYGAGGGGSVTSTYEESTMDEVNEGTKISDTELAGFIAEMNYDVSKTMIENLSKQAENNGTTITELLLNPEKSGLLVEILKKLCGDTNAEIDTTSTEDSKLIQKILLAKLAGQDDDVFASISDNTLLKGLKYLSAFAKENNISITDLLYDDKYSDLLFSGLSKLYSGEELNDYRPSQDEISGTKTYIDDVASKNSTTSEKLLESSGNKDKVIQKTETKVIKSSAKEEKSSGSESTKGAGGGGTTTTTTSGDTPVDISNLPKVGENTSSWETLDDKWVVATTAASVPSYSAYVKGKISQNADSSKYGDKCLSFAETHAYALYTGNTGDSADSASNYPHGGAFTSWFSDSKEETLQKIYSEIVSGKPVVIQVNGNKAGTSRHFVTVVGFKSSVTDANSITEDDLLIIDSWDGQTERMDQANSRFLTTGAACGKNYSGYYLRVLK